MINKIKENKRLKYLLGSLLAIVTIFVGTIGIVKATTSEPTNIASQALVQIDVADISNTTEVGIVTNLTDGESGGAYKRGFYPSNQMDEYFYFTLDNTYDISKLVAKFNTGGTNYERIPEKFSMSIWNGKAWEDVGAKTDADTNKSTGETIWDFSAQTKKTTAVRFHVTQVDCKLLWINEIEIWGVKSNDKLTKPQIITDAQNLALNAEVEMTVPTWASNFTADKLNDGIVLTHNNFATGDAKASAESTDTIVFQLQEASLINKVTLYPIIQHGTYKGGFPVDFTISAYNGEKWVEVKNVTNQSVGAFGTPTAQLTINSYKFDPIDATAVRITVTKMSRADSADSGAYVVRLGEVKIHGVPSEKEGLLKPGQIDPNKMSPITGQNMALNATVEMNVPSWALTSFPATELVDNILFTHNNFATANCPEEGPETVTLVLEKSSKLHSIALYPAVQHGKYIGGFPIDFVVEGYNGSEWVELTRKTNQQVGTIGDPLAQLTIQNYTFTETEVSAVRIIVTEFSEADSAGSGAKALRFGEIQLMGYEAANKVLRPDGTYPPEPQQEQPKKPITGRNMALDAVVEMNVPDWAKNDYSATELVDNVVLEHGNFATTNGIQQTTSETITLELKQASKLHSVVLYPAVRHGKYVGGFPVDFTLEGYNGTSWVTLTTQANQNIGAVGVAIEELNINNYTFDEVEVSAVRLTVTKHSEIDTAGSGGYALRLGEIQLMGSKSANIILKPGEEPEEPLAGSNVALNADIEMTVPSWATSFQAEELVNGIIMTHNDFATGNIMKQTDKDTITIAFKEASKVDTVLLYPAVQNGKYIGGYPVDFTISIYDGTKWVDVKKVVGESIGEIGADMASFKVKRYQFDAVDATGVRITVTKHSEVEKANSGAYAIRLGELEVYGEKSTKTDMKKPAINPANSNSAGSGTGTSTGSYANKLTEIDNTGNLALFRPTKASSHLGDYGAPTEKINDGIFTSYWCSDNREFEEGKVEWVEVNLLNNFAINRVVLGARQMAYGFPHDFTIEVFYDGEWKVAHTVKGFVADERAPYCAYEFTFPAVIGNKVRLSSNNFRKVDTLNSLCITELAVYGNSVSGKYVLPNENMLTSGTAVSATTSMEDYDYYLINLTDNNLKSGWSSIPAVENEPQTIEFDMKGEVQLSEIQMKPGWGGHGFPIDFVISVLKDGQWVDVYEAKDIVKPEDEAIQRYQFETQKTSKFRITVTKMAKESGMYAVKLNEVMAYPNHTGDEFDPNRVEVTASYVKPEDAEVIQPNVDDLQKGVRIQTVKMVAGIAVIVVALGGCVLTLLLSRKKSKK